MSNGQTGYATGQLAGRDYGPPAAVAPKEVEIGLLEQLQGALNIAHDRVSRLEGLAARVFGEEPSNAAIAPAPVVIGDAVLVSARNLVERLNAAVHRLERIA